jgi:hypothetical protein
VSTALRHTETSPGAPWNAPGVRPFDADPARLLHAPDGTRHPVRAGRGTEGRASGRAGDAELLERLRTLRAILPAMATEVAIARREGARLRRENARLCGLLERMEGSLTAGGRSSAVTGAAALEVPR